jgi:hypothetical protein
MGCLTRKERQRIGGPVPAARRQNLHENLAEGPHHAERVVVAQRVVERIPPGIANRHMEAARRAGKAGYVAAVAAEPAEGSAGT